MSADAWGAVVRELLDRLDPYDLELLTTKVGSRATLEAAMAEQTAALAAHVRPPVGPELHLHLAAATLTWQNEPDGVQVAVRNAVTRFATVGRPDVPIEVAVLVRSTDDAATVALMSSTFVATAAVAAARPTEPRMFQRMVVATVADALPALPLVETATAVLDRGAHLAARYRGADRPLPEPGLPLLGNVDFLLAIAGYEAAVAELTGGVADPLDRIGEHLPVLAQKLRQSVVLAANKLDRGGVDEPDIVWFLEQAAQFLGGKRVQIATTRLDRALHRARRPARSTDPAVDPASRRAVGAPAADAGPVELEHLAEWVVAVLATGPVRVAGEEWLRGLRLPDAPDDLPELVERLWRLRRLLEGPLPDAVPAVGDRRLVQHVAAALAHARAAGHGPHAARLVAAMLPPLWERRWPASRGLAAWLRTRSVRPQVATVVATMAACGPAQSAVAGSEPQHDGQSCAPAESGRCAGRRTGPPVPAEVVCPARPWSETGLVDSYRTLAELTERADPGSVGRTWRSYAGPWHDLVRVVPART